ncbi:MAG TPA: response regulator [Candidatus Polarisedimenticolaceae bacterium]|nr:response regulator [Candidatus Polarisedimenticolaceae bacterium]
MNILVVEDDESVAELLRRALELLGNHCYLAPDAQIADRILHDTAVDAVTLDLGIPGRDGLEWLETMAVSRPRLAGRTLVITGLAVSPDLAQRMARCGAGLLAKPFTLELLAEAVRAQLGWQRPN